MRWHFMPPIETKLERVKKALEFAYKDYVTYEQALVLFESLKKSVEDVKAEIRNLNVKDREKLEQGFGVAVKKIESKVSAFESVVAGLQKSLNSFKKEALDSVWDAKKIVVESKKELSELEKKIPTKTDLRPIQADLAILEKALKDKKNRTPEQTRDDLESLEGKERLDKSAINGLEDDLKRIEKLANAGGTRFFGGANANAVQVADLSAQCNGVLKSFYVPKHRFALMLQSTQFPVIYRPTIDFTTANNTLTLTAQVGAPETGQTLLFLYVK